MKRLFHYGDSYAVVNDFAKDKHFCGIMADILELKYLSYGYSGLSNEQLLNQILKDAFEYASGDVIFINFSFFQRGCWYDSKNNDIKSTNVFYDELKMKNTDKLLNDNQQILSLVNYYVDYPEDYAKKIFKLFNTLITNLVMRGVKVFYIFVESTPWSNSLLNSGVNINFPNGFSKWLIKNNLHLEQDSHYSQGIQPMLADMILRKTNNLDVIDNIINITNEDIDAKKLPKNNLI